MVEEAAELQGILEGLRKAKDHNIARLVLCAKVSLLKQVSDVVPGLSCLAVHVGHCM
jgi:hypothetical protein